MHFVNRLPLTEDSCYEITKLELRSDEDHEIIDDDLAHILPYCPNLEFVSLSGVPDLTDRTVIILAHTAPLLRELDLSGCTQVTDLSIGQLVSVVTDLKVVRLNGLKMLTDLSVSALARCLVNLLELELSDLPLLTAASIRDIWTFSMKLQRLKLSGCICLTDKAFPSSSRSSIAVSGTSASAQTRSRTSNNISSSNSIKHPVWPDNMPPLLFSSAHKLSNLRVLDVSRCARLTDAAIAGIVAHAPRIRDINLSDCTALTDAAAAAVATLGSHLTVLAMARVEQLTDRGVVSIVRACTKLKSVDVSFNPLLTDLAVLELVTLPLLQRLSIAGLSHVTDNALLFLAEHAPSLERLHLSHCRNLSLDAIHVVLQKLTKLEHLSASSVPALKRVGVERFSERPPRDYSRSKQGVYRVFLGDNIQALAKFLDKEQARRRAAEEKNVIFVPRADDSLDLY